MNYWLMKSEPHVFSFEDLRNAPKKTTPWEGVRNYQARNFMMKEMKLSDQILFYHSSIEEPCVAGLAYVSSLSYPDQTSWDKNSPYYDPKSTKENPRWFVVDVTYLQDFTNLVTLKKMREEKKLEGLLLLRKGQRLSIQPVSKDHFDFICALSNEKGGPKE